MREFRDWGMGVKVAMSTSASCVNDMFRNPLVIEMGNLQNARER
jgi:hypothetical protein